MTPCEWSLLEEGYLQRRELQDRRIARWLSPLISAAAGNIVTAAQLLGEELEADQANDTPRALREAERKLNAKLKAIARKSKRKITKEAECQA